MNVIDNKGDDGIDSKIVERSEEEDDDEEENDDEEEEN